MSFCVVHRLNIAEAAMKTFKSVLSNDNSFGLYSGNNRDADANFIFTTIQTMSRDSHLKQFNNNHFDYIIIDETHRKSRTDKKVLDYLIPPLLGMTATPERTDGFDIFSLFDHTIAYEIRLHQALEENMLAEFHYYGVQDLTINGEEVEDKSEFRYLEAPERVNNILETSERYGTDDGIIRGLVFVLEKKEECHVLSIEFNKRGYRTLALTGDSSEQSRVDAIKMLESNDSDRLDYIFTVDIFNEGIDIPKVNQTLCCVPQIRPLFLFNNLDVDYEKVEGNKYVTIIDFIGNYQNNYLVPIALYGDTS